MLLRRLRRLIFIMAGVLPLQACSSHYSAQAIEAWIVDAETKQPLKDVNVVAHWEIRQGIEDGRPYQLQIMETVTDKNGRFYFPAWGPKEIPSHLPSGTRMQNKDPQILFFKSGYYASGASNSQYTFLSWHGPSMRASELNGKTFPFKKFQGGAEEYALNVAVLVSSLHFVDFSSANDCEWKSLPRMIVALTKEVKAIQEQNNTSQYFSINSIDKLPRQSECGSAREFFKEYLK